jgi:hypothetical protein
VGQPCLHGGGRRRRDPGRRPRRVHRAHGFGIDSAIEGFASTVIVWRFTGHRILSEAAERRVSKLVAIQFFVLAPYVGVESLMALVQGETEATQRADLGDRRSDASLEAGPDSTRRPMHSGSV